MWDRALSAEFVDDKLRLPSNLKTKDLVAMLRITTRKSGKQEQGTHHGLCRFLV